MMNTMKVQMSVPVGMSPYLNSEDTEISFAMNAMMLYPLIKNLTISHGKAAEILGVHKTDLIEFYGAMGIPYLDQSEEEFLEDLSSINRLLGVVAVKDRERISLIQRVTGLELGETEAIVCAEENNADINKVVEFVYFFQNMYRLFWRLGVSLQ